jgi:hypothetical protein
MMTPFALTRIPSPRPLAVEAADGSLLGRMGAQSRVANVPLSNAEVEALMSDGCNCPTQMSGLGGGFGLMGILALGIAAVAGIAFLARPPAAAAATTPPAPETTPGEAETATQTVQRKFNDIADRAENTKTIGATERDFLTQLTNVCRDLAQRASGNCPLSDVQNERLRGVMRAIRGNTIRVIG